MAVTAQRAAEESVRTSPQKIRESEWQSVAANIVDKLFRRSAA